MEKLPEAIRSHYTPVGYDLEPELKISIATPPSKIIHDSAKPSDAEAKYIQKTFLDFAKSFHRNAFGSESYIDSAGATPRDYALVNLGQDTGCNFGNWVVPQMTIARNGYQYRERFALAVFSGKPLSTIGIANFDANAKTLLSEGIHRKEFETGGDSQITNINSFETFRQVANLPEFFHEIDSEDLYVIKAWMTSRSSFLTLTRIPNSQIFALCEHCCDITKYTTANFEQFINNGHQDPEWETEVKGFYGQDNRLNSEQGQIELIDTLFKDIYTRFKTINPDIATHDLSKMERAKAHTSKFYSPVSVYKDVPERNNPMAKLLNNLGICSGLAHAFTHAIKAKDVTDVSYLPRMIGLATSMPNPNSILDNTALIKHITSDLSAYKVA
jgi:hypothetical protein